MLKSVIVEDESIHMEHLKKMLNKFCPEIKIVKEITSGNEAINLLPKLSFDLLLLDIELGDTTAFKILEKLPWSNFHIIFVTAFDKYALQAFKVNAIDYILKPVEGKDLRIAVSKALKQIYSEEKKQNLLTDYHLSKSKCLCISESKTYTFIPCSTIQYCYSSGNYTEIHYEENGNKQKVLATKNLLYFEKKLMDYQFIRIHQSVLVNREKIKKIIKRTGELILDDGMKFEIARNRKKNVLELLAD